MFVVNNVLQLFRLVSVFKRVFFSSYKFQSGLKMGSYFSITVCVRSCVGPFLGLLPSSIVSKVENFRSHEYMVSK